MYYPDSVIDEVRSRNDIVSVIGSYIALKRSGSGYQGLCPFHNEKTPSFHVNPQLQIYKCFGCQKGGNVITFVMEYENVSFPEALRILADRSGYTLPQETESDRAKENRTKREKMMALYKEAAEYYYRKLRASEGKYGMEYLTGRQLSRDTMREFGLGYSDGRLYETVKGRYDDALLNESGLFTFRENTGAVDKFFNRVMFPIFDQNGRVIAFGGRVMGDAKPKYLNSPESPIFNKSRNLYHLNLARKSRRGYLILCEGYMDVIALTQAGFDNAVATLGTALTEQQATLIARYVKEVILTYDSDEAGQTAINRAIPILYAAGVGARIVDMSPYKDPDEFIKALGAEAYEERIRDARPSYRFEIEFMKSKHAGEADRARAKTEFERDVAAWMLRFESRLERENYMKLFCEEYRVDYRAFAEEVNKAGAAAERRARPAETEPQRAPEVVNGDGEAVTAVRAKKRDEILNTQDYLVTLMASNPKARRVTRKYLTPEDFTGTVYQDVVARCYAMDEDAVADVATLVSRYETPEKQRLVADMLADEMALSTGDIAKSVEDSVMKVWQRRREDLISKAKEEHDDLTAIRMWKENKKLAEDMRRRLRAETY